MRVFMISLCQGKCRIIQIPYLLPYISAPLPNILSASMLPAFNSSLSAPSREILKPRNLPSPSRLSSSSERWYGGNPYQSLNCELKSLFNHPFTHISVCKLNSEKINLFPFTLIFLKIFFLFYLV